MARINLLPWREELREQRKQQFLVILGGVLVASAALVFLGDQYFTAAIENQNARNDFLRKEIVVLDARIKEISELKSRRQQLLERMKIIQDLQGNRPIIGRVFDQLVRTLPDGVYFTDLKMTGKNIAIAGAAESNNRVSNLMRNMDASEWLTAPTLNEVKAVKAQMKEMEESFGALLRQLPSDTEVPGLLEDITRTGLGSGLEFEEIKLLPEVAQQFYIELPIQISVVGGYHDLATFVSGVSSLPRIVTLHDFEIKPVAPGSTSKLRMSILAKTYRYNDKGLKK